MTVEEDLVPEVGAVPTETLRVFGRTAPGASREEVVAHLSAAARAVRARDIQMVRAAGLGHIGGEFSVIDVLVTLYLHAMDVSPDRLDDPDRDRFILSKGHAAAALYTTLATAGFLPPEQLGTFMQPLSQLNGHPARTKIDAVEASTGPLGHGLPIAVGTAFAGKLDGSDRRTFVVVGDGELQEGSNWEALMTAGNHRLEHLCVIVDRNRLQQGAKVEDTNDLEPLADKLRAFGLEVVEVDGHDHGALVDVFAAVPAASGKPTAVIAHTHKGHPISFMSDNVAWHHKVPSQDQVAQALSELEEQ
ncbi:transketolase [Cellulomonas hominis]|uniref:Transketolase n=1 Tax=Cellulomonas hominis TaxID=156981 RepID=A0A511F9W4_9CELL|nr:transketolase [Cellulomonas hominis]MBB5473371.1 transketolase [Cellulomonas hominis]MBU5421303.1 transketolase [Cellulomonas hominis]NKY07752.1 transketolase [Cellulomonas hominis]GEL45344.1 transketolase [Cellulomonas hominis]